MPLPERFINSSEEIQSEIVQLGILCWDLVQKEVLKQKDFDLAKLLEKVKEDGIQEEKLRRDIEVNALKARIDQEVKLKESLVEETIKQVQKEFDRNKALIIRESRLEEKELLQIKFSKEKEDLQEKITDLQIKITKLELRENWEDAFKKERAERENLQRQLDDSQKTKSSYEIGVDGEGEINKILSQIQEWDYEDTHEITGMGDFRLTNETGKVFMLDSKKYKEDVPKKEREKIKRDVDSNSGVLGGILVSLTSKIQTKKHCEIELTTTKKPICYLVLEGMDINAKRICLQATLNFMLQYVASNNEREKDALLDKIHQASIKLGELKSDNENQRNKAKELYDSLKVSGDKIQTIFNFIQDKNDEPESATLKKKSTKKKSET